MRHWQANAFQIKFFMAMLMVLDHLDYIPHAIPPLWAGIFHALTRCVGVWFAFMAVEGFLHTRNQLRYNCRLFVWAAMMFAGNHFLQILLAAKDIRINNNIFLTLAVGVLLLNVLTHSIKVFGTPEPALVKWMRRLLALGVFIIGLVGTEGGMIVLPFMVITFFFRQHLLLRNVLYVVFAVLLAVPSLCSAFSYQEPAVIIDMILFNSDWMFVSVLPFLYLYNGERGKKTVFTKYFFYVFYPLHLWVIAVIGYVVA